MLTFVLLETVLKITHPLRRFVTEAIWQELDWNKCLLSFWVAKGRGFDTKKSKELRNYDITTELR